MLKNQIHEEMIQALKNKDQVRLDVLRYIISTIKYEEIEKRKDLTDEETLNVLQKEAKKRKEALEMMKKTGKVEILQKEEKQIEIIQSYLPQMVSDSEVEKIIDEILAQNPNPASPGPIIGLVMAKLKGIADGSKVAAVVSKKIQK